MPNNFTGYTAKFAPPNEFGEILAFYADDERRTKGVCLLKEELIQQQVEQGLFLTIRNSEGKIVAASTLCTLAEGKKIDCIGNNNRIEETGTVLELGSVLRWKEEPNYKGLSAVGFWHPLLFGIPMIEAFKRSGKDLTFDLLICNIQTDLHQTIRRLTGAAGTKSPLHWEWIDAADQLVETSNTTTNDPNAQRRKQFFRGFTKNLPEVARYLLGCHKRGYLVNKWGDRLGLNMEQLPIDEMRTINTNRRFLEKLPSDISWNETNRLFKRFRSMPHQQP